MWSCVWENLSCKSKSTPQYINVLRVSNNVLIYLIVVLLLIPIFLQGKINYSYNFNLLTLPLNKITNTQLHIKFYILYILIVHAFLAFKEKIKRSTPTTNIPFIKLCCKKQRMVFHCKSDLIIFPCVGCAVCCNGHSYVKSWYITVFHIHNESNNYHNSM